MAVLEWDKVSERTYETGVEKGVLYRQDGGGNYAVGHAWNGLISVSESPSGAEPNKQYANNKVYVNLTSAEEFAATIEAFTYPDAFAECDGTAVPVAGLAIGQQRRKPFGLSYQTLLGNDTEGTDHGRKIHLIYGATAAPSEKAYTTVNDSPEALTFSWEVSTEAVTVPGMKPTSQITIDSTKVDAAKLADLEDILYGTAGLSARLPLPAEVIALFEGTVTEVFAAAPTYDSATDTITIPSTTGVDYLIDGEVVAAGPVVITEDTLVTATPKPGYTLSAASDDDWAFDYIA